MVLGMINHLRLKTAIKMTTPQKHEYRTTGYNNPWDPTTSITAYFTQLDRFQVSLGNHRIATSKEEKRWQRERKCGTEKCLQKTRWLHGKTRPRRNKRGQHSIRTSPTSGSNGNNTPRRRQNNCASRRQRFSPKRQQQQRKRENRKRCYLRCYRSNTTNRLQR